MVTNSEIELKFETVITLIIFSSPVGSLCHTPGVVSYPSSIVCHVSSVSTIGLTTRNNEAIKSIFSANVYYVSGLCLLV